jgi:hypothetical protein
MSTAADALDVVTRLMRMRIRGERSGDAALVNTVSAAIGEITRLRNCEREAAGRAASVGADRHRPSHGAAAVTGVLGPCPARVRDPHMGCAIPQKSVRRPRPNPILPPSDNNCQVL